MTNSTQNQLSTQIKGAFQTTSERYDVWRSINAYRDHGTHADEWLIMFRKLLLPISIAFTLVFGMALHFNLALPYSGKLGAVIFAGALTVFLEYAKIRAGIWFFRDLWFGLYQQGLSAALMTLMGGLIATGAFAWSYYNSTQGVQYLSAFLGEKHVAREIVDTKQATAAIDDRINTTLSIGNAGLNTKWKGTTTWEGQKIARRALAVQEQQEMQRTIALQNAAAEQAKKDGHREQFISKVGTLLSFLGGKMEWFQLFLLFGIVFCQKTLYERMKSVNTPAKEEQEVKNGNIPNSKSDNLKGAFYFNRGTDGNTIAATPPAVNGLPGNKKPETVSQCDTDQAPKNTVATVIGADQMLQLTTYRLRRDLPNLKNENGRPETIKKRLRDELATLSTESFFHPDFNPSPEACIAFLNFYDLQFEPVCTSFGLNLNNPNLNGMLQKLRGIAAEPVTA